ncbi:MAG: deoxyribonuclease V [Planctomycetes bacterium]|nr:deoxyribonuclease V [Planctomycetota bacterium]
MKYKKIHTWDVNYKEAVEIQKNLQKRVIVKNSFDSLDNALIAGADVSYDKERDRFFAAVIVFELCTMKMIEESTASGRGAFPYIPGLLSFRESPILTRAFTGLKREPDIFMLDAQGIAHPRGIGLASHIGILFDKPAVGCAKTRLIGEYGEVGDKVGVYAPLTVKERLVGAVLRTKKGVRPVFVSPGHKIDVPTSVAVVLKSCRGYRIPEPTRQAHNLVTKIRNSSKQTQLHPPKPSKKT